MEFFSESNFKLLTFVIPPEMLHFKMYIEINHCAKMEAFVSEAKPISTRIEKDFGNPIDLKLGDVKHDLNILEIEKGLDSYPKNSKIDFSFRIINFRLNNFLIKESVYINFFCAFWNQPEKESKFEGSLEMVWEKPIITSPTEEENNLEDSYKYWLELDANMFLYELRMMAEDFKELNRMTETFEQDSNPLTKDVGAWTF
jgi:hypothetical protein